MCHLNHGDEARLSAVEPHPINVDQEIWSPVNLAGKRLGRIRAPGIRRRPGNERPGSTGGSNGRGHLDLADLAAGVHRPFPSIRNGDGHDIQTEVGGRHPFSEPCLDLRARRRSFERVDGEYHAA